MVCNVASIKTEPSHRQRNTHFIYKLVAFFKMLCELTVGLDGALMLTTLEAIALDDGTNFRLEFTTYMRPT